MGSPETLANFAAGKVAPSNARMIANRVSGGVQGQSPAPLFRHKSEDTSGGDPRLWNETGYSVDILHDLLGASEQHLGMLHQAADHLEGGGVAEAVADALVGDHLQIHHSSVLGGTVSLHPIGGTLDTVGDEYGELPKL